MTKILILKPRLLDADGVAQWHDRYVLGNALQHITKNLSLDKLGRWISVAGKIAEEAEKANLGRKDKSGNQYLPEITVPIKNSEAEIFWKELIKLPFENFGANIVCRKCGSGIPNPPDVGTLYQMLSDIARAIGEKMPESDDDDVVSDEV